ncbi:FG-GAP-like repeat-containing protein [Streptomyces griseus]|uniref:FG-GAP-like repeat-containing protein n=1 Tax=Streptomyces griseus TaxID=1911 RepID=UPI000AC19A80|nr:FG-GAP-like repeat-containing protein [Streptomyces griseus]
MSRTAPARRTRTRAVLLAAVLVATGAGLSPGALAAPGAPVAGVDQLDVDPTWRTAPRLETVLAAGPKGYVHRTEDTDPHFGEPLEWTDFASGLSRPLGHGSGNDSFAETGTGGRYVQGEPSVGSRSVIDLETGTARALTVPEDSTYEGLVGDRLLFREYEPGTSLGTVRGWAVRAADAPDGPAVPVTGWPDGTNLRTARLVAGAPGAAVLRFTRGESGMNRDFLLGLVDLTTGQVRVLEAPTSMDGSAAGVTLTAERVAWVDADRTVHIRPRADLTGPEISYPLPEGLSATRIGLVGDWLLTTAAPARAGEALTRRLVALSPAGEQHTLLAGAEERITPFGDGSGTVAVTGGTSATDWSVLKAVPGKGGGAPVLEKLRRVAPLPTEVKSLALGMGRLTTLERDGAAEAGFRTRTLPVGPLHTGQSASAPSGTEPGAQWYDTPLFDTGDGRTVSSPRIAYTPRAVIARRADGRTTRVTVDNIGEVTDAFGRWAVYQTGTPGWYGELAADGETVVLDLDGQKTVSRQKQAAAAVWGDTLYTGTATAGVVARKDLATGKDLGTIATNSGCALTELQTAGRWLYWSCARYEKQGVLDLRNPAAPVRVALPRGAYRGGLLGDGYFVDQDAGSFLRVTAFSGGRAETPFSLTRADTVPDERRTTWTVDRFGGPVAYRGADQEVHAVWPGVPASDLTAPSSSAPASLRLPGAWKAHWTLSKPASYHEVTIREQYSGKTVRTFRADETRGRIDVAWDGRTAAGKTVPNGPYTWELRANTADGKGRDLLASGRIAVAGGQPAWRDLAGGDAQADLLATDAAGAVSMYRGTGYESHLSGRIAGSGAAFPAGTVLVPFGDVNGDGCADVLARVGGELRAYRPGCGKVVTASSPYTSVGSGWGQYDVLTSSGDVNGDGYPDLIARQAATGDVYFYGGTADHRLTSRVRIGTNWKLYKKLTGAGDLNRDGRGDLLGIDSAGVLWRYYGTATGGVTARVRIGGGWQGYTAVLGTGDLSGDGLADLLARDATGRLYAYTGRGDGLYADRVVIGQGGWNTYRSLS